METITRRLAARFGAEPDESELRLNSVIEQLLAHRSVRAFRADPLPEQTLPTMIAAAQSAATSSNLQAYSIIAVQDAARKERLSRLAGDQRHIRDCPLFLLFVADLSRLDRVAARLGEEAGANPFLEMFIVALVDAALAAQNAVIAAESMGLGTVYIGGMRNQPEAVRDEVGLPPRAFVSFGLCVGWPDSARPAAIKPRLASASILHHERYGGGEGEAVEIDAYDQRMRVFQGEQSMAEVGWTGQAAARVAGAGTLSGRDRIRDALESLGFELR
ncbi:MAG: nitroreductase family protein [Burkholderiaceae bacterium]